MSRAAHPEDSALSSPSCAAHPKDPAVARCQRCNTAMCGVCFRLLADDRPCCEVCALELASGPPSRWPFAVAFLGMALAICVVGARFEGPSPSLEIWIPAGLIALVIALVMGLTGPQRDGGPKPVIRERERDAELAAGLDLLGRARNPYRTRLARAARRVIPLSGRATALVLTAAFVLSAGALPALLRLPRWIEFELVLVLWWLLVAGLLSVLLFKGWRLAEDHRLKIALPGAGESGDGKPKGGWDAPTGCAEAGGCGEALVIVLVLAAAAVAAWLLVEIVLPVLVFAVYYFVVKAMGRVARDQHGCESRIGRSLFWGAVWATAYVAPLSALVWGVHAIIARSQ